MKRVVLLNVWHDDNAGDSAIAQACIQAAQNKWPRASIEVHTMLSRGDRAFQNWCKHLIGQFPHVSFLPAFYPEPLSGGVFKKFSVGARAVAAMGLRSGLGRSRVRANLTGAEAVILVGGSDLFDVRRRITSRFRLLRITAAAMDAISLDIPVYLWGHTLGPFETRAGREIMAPLLEAAERVLVRDSDSLRMAQSLAPTVRAELVPDLGFHTVPCVLPDGIVSKEWGRYVAIVPRRHFFDKRGSRTDRLLEELASFSRSLLAQGKVDSIVLVPQVVGPSRVEDDRLVVSQLAKKIGCPRVYVLDGDKLSPSQFAGIYARADGVISVRLHGAILAMTGGTPALAISYFTGKTAGVMEGLGFGDSWVDFDDCNASTLMEWWSSVASAFGRRELIERRMESVKQELSAHLEAP